MNVPSAGGEVQTTEFTTNLGDTQDIELVAAYSESKLIFFLKEKFFG